MERPEIDDNMKTDENSQPISDKRTKAIQWRKKCYSFQQILLKIECQFAKS